LSISDCVYLAGKPQPPLGEVQEDKLALRVGNDAGRHNALVRSRSAVVPRSHSHPDAKHTGCAAERTQGGVPQTAPIDSNYDKRGEKARNRSYDGTRTKAGLGDRIVKH